MVKVASLKPRLRQVSIGLDASLVPARQRQRAPVEIRGSPKQKVAKKKPKRLNRRRLIACFTKSEEKISSVKKSEAQEVWRAYSWLGSVTRTTILQSVRNAFLEASVGSDQLKCFGERVQMSLYSKFSLIGVSH